MSYNQKKGFTLIELLITISIIGILSSIAIPAYMGLQAQARRGSLIHACNGSVPELQSWINAVKRSDALRLLEEQIFSETAQYTSDAANIAAIQADLPGFQPGQNPVFSYQIVQNFAVDTPITNPPTWTTAQNPCFTAVATGNTGTRVASDTFAIECNNNKNF